MLDSAGGQERRELDWEGGRGFRLGVRKILRETRRKRRYAKRSGGRGIMLGGKPGEGGRENLALNREGGQGFRVRRML